MGVKTRRSVAKGIQMPGATGQVAWAAQGMPAHVAGHRFFRVSRSASNPPLAIRWAAPVSGRWHKTIPAHGGETIWISLNGMPRGVGHGGVTRKQSGGLAILAPIPDIDDGLDAIIIP